METGDMLFGRRTRQNHALEHATVTLLSRVLPNLNASARSNAHGFIIFADLPVGEVREASQDALERLQAGESELAIHPNCGTNLAVGLSLAIAGSLFALTALRPRTRIATMMAGSLAGATVARPVGTLMQRYITTLPDVHDIRIRSVRRRRFLGRWVVEVLTESYAG
ncbi:MAG TPA: DUF6391 domain-containing protein [Ktedonobacterales bacterium]|nr:DUF6391 domain-containing protein [Ktedonobacterales bacterium]